MKYNRVIECIGDHADVVALLLTVLFLAVATRFLMELIVKIREFYKRRLGNESAPLHTKLEEPAPDSVSDKKKAKPSETKPKQAQTRDVNAYVRLFLSPGQGATIRQGVYIDRELHTKISTLVGIVGKRNLTVGNYVDSILIQHFEQYGDEVKTICSKQVNKIL